MCEKYYTLSLYLAHYISKKPSHNNCSLLIIRKSQNRIQKQQFSGIFAYIMKGVVYEYGKERNVFSGSGPVLLESRAAVGVKKKGMTNTKRFGPGHIGLKLHFPEI
jgi:hypothetical protein